MLKLPKRSNSQKIGVSAAELCNAVFREFYNIIPFPQVKQKTDI